MQKAEQTFKNVVNSNKQYFESVAEFGQAIQEGIKIESKDLDDPFYNDREEDDSEDQKPVTHLDQKIVRDIVMDHLQKEGLKETFDSMRKEIGLKNQISD